MTIGNPYLATWTPADHTMRLFHQAVGGGNFLQSATTSLPQSVGSPFMVFMNGGQSLMTYNSDKALSMTKWDLNLTFVPSQDEKDIPSNNGVIPIGFAAVQPNLLIAINDRTSDNTGFLSTVGNLADQIPTPVSFFTDNMVCAAAHPLGFAIAAFSTSEPFFHSLKQNGTLLALDNVTVIPKFAVAFEDNHGLVSVPCVAKFTADGTLLIVGCTDGLVYVYEFAGNGEFNLRQVLNLAPISGATVTDIGIDPTDNSLAIGWGNSSLVYQTLIFKRNGFTLVPNYNNPTFSFGKMLAYTGDGLLLIDAGNKTCWTLDSSTGIWSDTSTLVAALPIGVSVQALNFFTPAVTQSKFVYDFGAKTLADHSVTLSALALVPFNGVPVFNPTNTTVTQVLGDGGLNIINEVILPGCVSGGIPLVNATFDALTTDIQFYADDIVRIIIDPVELGGYLIYDQTNGAPLIMVKFSDIYTTNAQSQLTFSLHDLGFVSYK